MRAVRAQDQRNSFLFLISDVTSTSFFSVFRRHVVSSTVHCLNNPGSPVIFCEWCFKFSVFIYLHDIFLTIRNGSTDTNSLLPAGYYKTEQEKEHCRCLGSYFTCLKLPFFLCSQSIMSWKIGIMIFRTSGCGTSVTPRKGPIIPGIKWILCSPVQHKAIVIK